MRHLIVLTALTFVACVTPMHERVFANIKVGDPASKVQQLLGSPNVFRDSNVVPGAVAWLYHRGWDDCGFTINDNIVVKVACDSHEAQRQAQMHRGISEMITAGAKAHENQPAPQPSAPPPQATTTCTTEHVPLSMTGETVTTCH